MHAGELTIATVIIFATSSHLPFTGREEDLKNSAIDPYRAELRQHRSLRWRDKDLIGFIFNEYWPDSARYIPVYA